MPMLGPFLETLIGGLLTGVLYSLVALGFVLIFKASGVFNFAQGAMVLFAALTLARLTGEIDGREVHLANFVVAAAIVGTALAFIAWYAWHEFVARGGGNPRDADEVDRQNLNRRTLPDVVPGVHERNEPDLAGRPARAA